MLLLVWSEKEVVSLAPAYGGGRSTVVQWNLKPLLEWSSTGSIRFSLCKSSYGQWWHEERAKTRAAHISLRGNVGGDQRVRRPLQQHRRLSGLVQRCADKGAVDQHRELTCECIGSGAMQPFRDDFQAATQFALMCCGELARGMLDLRKLRGDVELRATAVLRLPSPFAYPGELRVEFRSGVVGILCRDRLPRVPEVVIHTL